MADETQKPIPPKTLLTAHRLIHEYGMYAEEHATSKLWEAQQAKDEIVAATWQSLIGAIKEIRRMRNQL